jgi:hypothetical protein
MMEREPHTIPELVISTLAMRPANTNFLQPITDAVPTAPVLLLTLLALRSTETQQQVALEPVYDVQQMLSVLPQLVDAHAPLVLLAALQLVVIALPHVQHPHQCVQVLILTSARLGIAERVQLIVLLLMFALLAF